MSLNEKNEGIMAESSLYTNILVSSHTVYANKIMLCL